MDKLRFENRHGIQLTGTLELPPGGEWRATALFAHCFTCSRNIRAARDVTRALARAGFAVLRFDFTGLGESEGEFADTSFASNLDDLEDAARWLAGHYAPPQLLVGHSLGGTAVLAVAERLESVRAVATLGAPASPEHVLRQFGSGLEQIEEEGSAEVELAGRSFRVRRDFVADARRHPLGERLARLRRALLVLHSPVDAVVPVGEAQKIFVAAKHPKSFVSLDDADHLLSRSEHSTYAGNVIAAWAARFLELPAPEPAPGARVRGLTADGFLGSVQAGPHALVTDEPADKGGRDLGPDPYQFLAAALGSCTVMTLNMYARHKKLPVTRVSCEVTHRRVHAEDCADCEQRDGHIHELSRVIAIEGELEPAQRERMLQIADRCPVHRTLEGEIKIRSELAEP
ncbi:bifunctional alpha/beta hydrolase/OsmC family protein [Thioalkalivibrio sp. XN8]|uniref:bifunctional alpha/beta hydrolase/OsmC family protein n=1 Tax=Thioalkalivibrio sp. XN8 TaxID=2712863 RepID=UPI0013EC3986|nr:bifunctional alpha/beta hydrolase/OsmC family protein [Thioalkalivibrio sp. XN8]NGP52012.1 OsmC family protein [Thioalkalivibrio sp. XN8]